MEFKKNKKGFLIVILIIIVAIGIYSLTLMNNFKEETTTLSLARNTSFGIKYPISQRVIENIISGRNYEVLPTLEMDFLETYNKHAVLKGKDSEAFFNDDSITLEISQATWSSTWYVDLKFDALKVNQNRFKVMASFEFIYGPTENIYLERFQGDLAKEDIIELIKGTLNSLNELSVDMKDFDSTLDLNSEKTEN